MKRTAFYIGIVMLACGDYVFADEATAAKLDTCIWYYQDGDYQMAADSIKALLPLISDRREEAEAYKYLGFSYVMLDLINKAKEFFRVALEKFPQMVIDTLEVPPNISIVFKQAKLETQMEKGEILEKTVQQKKSKRTMIASVLTGIGTVSAGTAGFFLYKGFKDRRAYHTDDPTADFDRLYSTMNLDFIISGCSGGVALPTLFFGIKMFLSTPIAKAGSPSSPAGIEFTGNSVALTVRF